MDDIRYEVFAERLHQPFVLRRHDGPGRGEPIAAVLVECSRFPDNGRSTGYNLSYRTAFPTPAEQANYLVEADKLTPTPIFSGSGGTDAGRSGIPRRLQPTPRRMRTCHE